jgi:hypothetical protein
MIGGGTTAKRGPSMSDRRIPYDRARSEWIEGLPGDGEDRGEGSQAFQLRPATGRNREIVV